MPMIFSTVANIFDDLVNNFSPEELVLIGLLITIAGIRILVYANEESKKSDE